MPVSNDRQTNHEAFIQRIYVQAYCIPTQSNESDGTVEWDHTTLVYVEISAHNQTGIGFTYADKATAVFITEHLAPLLNGQNAINNTRLFDMMQHEIRNLGNTGIAAMAISAVDIALWYLKSKLLGLPLVTLLGQVVERIPVYGSGGFTSYSTTETKAQFLTWKKRGISMFKMKVGRNPEQDEERVKDVSQIVGESDQLMVDANGKFAVKEALKYAELFSRYNVSWFEEPVSSDHLKGLNFLRNHSPAGMTIAAGEYGYNTWYFKRMLDHQAVDVLQADATRCGGITGFMKVASLCDAYQIPLSAHTAPAIHLHPCCSARRAIHIEYFYDHERIERLLFKGHTQPEGGLITPNMDKPGIGLELNKETAEKFKVS